MSSTVHSCGCVVLSFCRGSRNTSFCADDGSDGIPAPTATFSIAPKKHVNFDGYTIQHSTFSQSVAGVPLGAEYRSEHVHDVDLVVGWEGLDDPENPRNWTRKRRWILTLVVSLFTFIRCVDRIRYCLHLSIELIRIRSPVASSISSPALPVISADLKIPPGSILENMSLSIFVLAYALGVSWEPPAISSLSKISLSVATGMGTIVRVVWKTCHSTSIQYVVFG